MTRIAAIVRTGVAAAGIGILLAAPAASQVPPETNLYELVDPGPPATGVPQCSCVAAPFALPAYRPDVRGTASAARLIEERASLPQVADDALTGNGNASLSLAMHLREEHLFGGKEVTEEEAARWLHLAAQQEHPDAFMLLGYRYAHGVGVPQDDRAAAYWFYQGAVRGESVAMLALGLRYAGGQGVEQNFAAAVQWWGRAERLSLATRLLGDAYACGLGVAQNVERAARAYQRAADAGDASGSIQLGHLYAGGCASNDTAAVAAYRRGANEGYPEAQVALSELLRVGRGADPNPPEAYHWARLAERQLPDGTLKALAAARAQAAASLMTAEEVEAQERVVDAMIAASKPQQ